MRQLSTLLPAAPSPSTQPWARTEAAAADASPRHRWASLMKRQCRLWTPRRAVRVSGRRHVWAQDAGSHANCMAAAPAPRPRSRPHAARQLDHEGVHSRDCLALKTSSPSFFPFFSCAHPDRGRVITWYYLPVIIQILKKGEATDGLAHTGRATGARALTSTLPCGHVAPRMG